MCICMRCGDIYRRIAWNNRGKKSTVWRCCTRVEHGPSACSAPTIPEPELQQATVDAINEILKCSEQVIRILEENIKEVLAHDNTDEVAKINVAIAEKQKELLELVQGKKDYSICADEMELLRQEKKELLIAHAKTEGVKQRIDELLAFIHECPKELTEYDESMVRKYIEQIKVYEWKFTVCFKAKVEIEISR